MSYLFSLLASSGLGRAFRHRQFSVYIIAHAGSVIGLWIQRIAIQWLVWTLTGSYAWLGAIALVEALASMLFSLMSGPLADRFDRVKLALLTQGLLMLVALALALVTWAGLASIPLIAGFVILTGMLEGIWAPVRLALMPNMVPREDMAAAVAITSMIFTAAIFVGPAIGGAIIAFVGVEGAFVANAISYVGLLLVFCWIKVPAQAKRTRHSSGFMGDLQSGFRYIMSSKPLASMVMFGFAFSLLVRPFRELFAGVADEVFNRGSDGLAALATASGFGALVGAMVMALYGKTRGLAAALYLAAGASLAMLVVFAQSTSFVLSLAMVAGLSACITCFGTGAQMLIQMSLTDDLRGRVMSVWQSQFRGIPAVGAWLVGLAEPRFGLSGVLTGMAALFLLFLLLTHHWRRRFGQLEQMSVGAP